MINVRTKVWQSIHKSIHISTDGSIDKPFEELIYDTIWNPIICTIYDIDEMDYYELRK